MTKPSFPVIKAAFIIALPLSISLYIHSLSWWAFIKFILDFVFLFLAYQFLKDAFNAYKYELRDYENFKDAENKREKRIKDEESLREREKIRKEKIEKEEQINNAEKNKEVNSLKYDILNKIKEIESTFTDTPGEVKLISNDFTKLMAQYEKQIIEIESKSSKNFVLQFVKISNYIKEKRTLIQSYYDNFINYSNQFKKHQNFNINNIDNIKKQIQFLNNGSKKLSRQISIYEQSIFHSLNMIVALVENKMFVFYEIFEVFDKAGVFDTKWQNVVVNKLSSIDNNLVDISTKIDTLAQKLDEINDSIKELDNNIQTGFENLSYCFQDSISDLSSIVSSELDKINSNIQFNNLLSAIQTRKLYQIRRDTKRLN
jgi:hypothetical protein